MIAPLFDNLLVTLDPKVTQTASGLSIPQSAQDSTLQRATVLAAGPGKFTDGVFVEVRIKVGDRVVLAPGARMSKVDDKEVIVTERDLLAVEEKS